MPGKKKQNAGVKRRSPAGDRGGTPAAGDEHDSPSNRDRYQSLFEESLDALYITNRDGIIIDLNRAGCEILGYASGELVGQNVEITFAGKEDRNRIVKALETNNQIKDYELILKRKDGTHVLCLVTAMVRRSAAGEVLGYQGIIRDITGPRQLELKLKVEYERAEFYNDLMSHDINNFNQGAMSNLELLLLTGELSVKGERYARNAMDQISGSANLISNLRKIRAVESGEIAAQTVDALELLEDAILRSRALFPGREIDITVTHENPDAAVIGNKLLLEVYINLITNAVKFNRNPNAAIEIVASNHESGFLKLEFRDNGPGIEDNMKKKIFDRSLRLHPEIWGTGLGLTLVRSIIESYGGTIYVEDRVKGDHSRGSNFILILRRGS